MKKIIITSIFVLLLNLSFSQMKPGRYHIRLAENNKTVYCQGGNTITLQETSDTSLGSQNFLWDVKASRGQPGSFIIQKVSNLQCLTFKINPSTNTIYEDTWMEPQMPLAKSITQSFQIRSVGNGNYTIQPNNGKDNEVYFAAKMSNMNSSAGDLQFENKNQNANPTTYNNTSNIYFIFFNAQIAASSVVVATIARPLQSPAVFVAPPSDNKIDLDFKTGNDDLDPKDFMEGVKVTLKIRNKPDLVTENVNESKNWPNNSVRRVTINLPADAVCTDIYEIIVSRKIKNGFANNMTAIVGDNWNLQKITVNTRIKVGGIIKSGTMDYMSPRGSSFPLYRFIYENRDSDSNTGTSYTLRTSNICSSQNSTPASTTTSTTNANLTCIIGTGGDNLEGGGNNNVTIRIMFKSSAKIITIRNINGNAKWNNFTENTVTKIVPNSADIDINDIKEIEVRHTGVGGMNADNWDVDKIKISISKDGNNKVLVDRIDKPIHRFTGDTRGKKFLVE